MPDVNAMNSLLAAVEAAAATTTPQPISPPTTSNPISKSTPITLLPKLASIHYLHPPNSHSMPSNSLPNLPSSSVPPPPPLPPSLPSPPPLPPSSSNPTSIKPTITVHEASPPQSFREKRKGSRIFSPDEKKVLEANYARNKFPSRLHMQTLARAMGKTTDKVRTWYNNRRALDRKLGIDVVRNSITDKSPLSQSPDTPFAATGAPVEEPVFLPSRVIASPLPPAHNAPSPAKPELPSDDAFDSVTSNGLVDVTPSAIAWAPSVSPITVDRLDLSSPSPPSAAPTRFRVSPLRIRNSRLSIGGLEICGDMPEDPSRDQGLEVKFLFGKKRVVYEWYYGNNFAEARHTGGPYAKVEMNFSSIKTMKLERVGSSSILQLSFATPAFLYLQTNENIEKYKVRAQQRQYRKVSAAGFPIQVISENHRIWMGIGDARRVSRILMEDNPALQATFQSWPPEPNVSPSPITEMVATPQHFASTLPQKVESAPSARYPQLSEPRNPVCSSDISITQAMAMDDLTRRMSSQSILHAPRQANMSPPPDVPGHLTSRPQVYGQSELPIVRTTTADGAAANLLASPAPWHSPTTPFISNTRSQGDECTMQWFPSGATPLGERSNLRTTPQDAAKVRRELNFNNMSNPSAETTTPYSPSRKRKASAIIDEDIEGNRARRQRLNDEEAQVHLQPLRFGLVDVPLPPQAVANVRPDEEQSAAQQNVSLGSVLHSLPR